MIKKLILSLAVMWAVSIVPSYAQSLANKVVPGSLTVTNCPGSNTPCFTPYSSTNPLNAGAISTASSSAQSQGASVSLSVDQYGSLRTLLMNPDGTAIDTTQPQTIQGNQIATDTTAQFTVSTSAVQLFAAASSLHHKGICNTSASVPLYYGFSSGVTTSTGMYLAPSACRVFEVSVPTAVIYGIAASSITVTTEGW